MSKEDFNQNLAAIVSPLLNWYDCHARILPWRENTNPYPVWISEIMLQQTRVEAVKPYFERWMRALPDLTSLANASEEEVIKLWEGLGYYSRVKNIHKAAKLIQEQYNGIFPSTFEALLSLPGIGEYTAGAIGSIAFRLPVPCVDGNVLRVVTRLTAENSDISLSSVKKILAEWVHQIVPKERPGDFNQAMMELGATVCLPNGQPKCEVCPVSSLCEAFQQNRICEFPNKSGKQNRKSEKRTVILLINGEKAALRKRPDKGLLAGLWEFPNLSGHLNKEEVTEILTASKLLPISIAPLKKVKHIFSHIEWDMTGYLVYAEERKAGQEFLVHEDTAEEVSPLIFQWIDAEALSNRLAVPAAFKAYHRILKEAIEKKF